MLKIERKCCERLKESVVKGWTKVLLKIERVVFLKIEKKVLLKIEKKVLLKIEQKCCERLK